MRIARIGGVTLPIPAPEYGGTQRSMAQMTAFQAALCAHDITIYAPSDSTIIPFTRGIAESLGLQSRVDDKRDSISIVNADGRTGRVTFRHGNASSSGYSNPEERNMRRQLMAELLRDEREQPFDLIHCHARAHMATDIIPSGLAPKTLVHQHNATLEDTYAKHPYPIIFISNKQAESQRQTYGAKVHDVIHHGLDSFAYKPSTDHAGYLAWIGRFLPEKGANRAIHIAKAVGQPLVMAGMIYEQKPESRRHFERDVAPLIEVRDTTLLDRLSKMNAVEARREIGAIGERAGVTNPVIFCGPANEPQKQELYGKAMATLFPISWPEPFGRVMIESFGCGTPVIGNGSIAGIDCGSVSEVVDNGRTGFVIHARNEGDALQKSVEAVAMVSRLDRVDVRRVFDQKWTSEMNAIRIDQAYRRFLGMPESQPKTSGPQSLLSPTQ